MKRISLIIFLIFLVLPVMADSISLEQRIKELERNVQAIDSNQLNYQIEKDLLKETYANNYENINIIITIVLGILGLLGYLGLKDISSIKKEYEKELDNLKNIKNQFDIKSQQFDNEKKKFEDELKSLIKGNEEQSNKIKFIELKDKAKSLLKDDQLTPALEFTNAALMINNLDADMLNLKGRILCRLNQIKEALDAFLIGREAAPNDQSILLNTTECLYFANEIELAKKIIAENKHLFESKNDGKLLILFSVIENYFSSNKDELIKIIREQIKSDSSNQASKKVTGWDFTEAIYFMHYQPESELRNIVRNILHYWNGNITGEDVLTNLDIKMP